MARSPQKAGTASRAARDAVSEKRCFHTCRLKSLPILSPWLNFLFFFYKFIYLFLAVLGLCCCARAYSSCGERGLHFVVVCRLLIAVASLVAEHDL